MLLDPVLQVLDNSLPRYRNTSTLLGLGRRFFDSDGSIVEVDVPDLESADLFDSSCRQIHQFGQQSVFDRQICEEGLQLLGSQDGSLA